MLSINSYDPHLYYKTEFKINYIYLVCSVMRLSVFVPAKILLLFIHVQLYNVHSIRSDVCFITIVYINKKFTKLLISKPYIIYYIVWKIDFASSKCFPSATALTEHFWFPLNIKYISFKTAFKFANELMD